MTRSRLLIGVASLAVVAVGAAAALYFFVLKSDPPAEVSIQGAVASLGTPTPTPGGATPAATAAAGAARLAGDWTIAVENSFVGYRVREQLARIGANTAVGRTSALQGTLTFDGTAITKLQVTADLTRLRSDESLRDGQLRTQSLETNRFPNATFVLTSPVQIGQPPAEGQTITKTIEGDLTLHGVTKRITIQVQGQVTNGQVVVVGSTEIVFADYNISQPRAASVLSTEDRGTMELQLVFVKAAG